MKTIDDLLNHPNNQVDTTVIPDYQELKKTTKDWIDKMYEYQLEYNITMYKLQIETLGISVEREGKIIK